MAAIPGFAPGIQTGVRDGWPPRRLGQRDHQFAAG